MQNSTYFLSLGYKWIDKYSKIIIQDFQRHAGITPDGAIGPITRGRMGFYNSENYCKEVFENIKPYKRYLDIEIEYLCTRGLISLGWAFNQYSKENDFDVLHNIAHAILESASGTSFIARLKNNIYGWRAYDLSPVVSANKFKTRFDCIERWSKWFNKTYLLDNGAYFNGNNEHGVNVRYASSPIAGINKSFIVRDLREKLNG